MRFRFFLVTLSLLFAFAVSAPLMALQEDNHDVDEDKHSTLIAAKLFIDYVSEFSRFKEYSIKLRVCGDNNLADTVDEKTPKLAQLLSASHDFYSTVYKNYGSASDETMKLAKDKAISMSVGYEGGYRSAIQQVLSVEGFSEKYCEVVRSELAKVLKAQGEWAQKYMQREATK